MSPVFPYVSIRRDFKRDCVFPSSKVHNLLPCQAGKCHVRRSIDCYAPQQNANGNYRWARLIKKLIGNKPLNEAFLDGCGRPLDIVEAQDLYLFYSRLCNAPH